MIKHSKLCFGLINNGLLQGISEIETDDSEVDVIQHAEDTVITGISESNPGGPVSKSAGKNKQYTHTVADSPQRNTVIMQKPGPSYLASPQRNTVIMQKPGPSYLASTEESVARYVSTGSLSSGHNASVGQEQQVIANLHSNMS